MTPLMKTTLLRTRKDRLVTVTRIQNVCSTELPEATDPSAVTLPDNTEDSQAILEELELLFVGCLTS